MEIFIIILITVVVFVFAAIRSNKNKKPKTLLDEILDNPIMKQSKEMYDMQCRYIDSMDSATDLDEIPNGEGEFGYTPTNPIPTRTSFGNISYLGRLTTLSGEKVKYVRLGSRTVLNIANPVDVYQISDGKGEICKLFLSMYHKKNSKKAPRDFLLKEKIF